MIEDVVRRMLAAKAEYERLEAELASLVGAKSDTQPRERVVHTIKKLLAENGPLSVDGIAARIGAKNDAPRLERAKKAVAMLLRSGTIRCDNGVYSLKRKADK